MPYRGLFLLLLLFLRGIISSLVYYWFTDIQSNTEWEERNGFEWVREVARWDFPHSTPSFAFALLRFYCSVFGPSLEAERQKKMSHCYWCILDALWRKLIVENCVDTFPISLCTHKTNNGVWSGKARNYRFTDPRENIIKHIRPRRCMQWLVKKAHAWPQFDALFTPY